VHLHCREKKILKDVGVDDMVAIQSPVREDDMAFGFCESKQLFSFRGLTMD